MDTLGRYSVLEDQPEERDQSGEGGPARWRKAFNHDLRCYAALAVIPKDSFQDEKSREQFAREVQLATGVRHRNLAAVFPLQTIEESYLYAMEFCDGETLGARVRRSGRLETLDALNIAEQTAAGLEAANTAGLLHRNVSADNIILLQDEEEISSKVLGLAFPGSSAAEDLSAATPEFDFRSPEEIAGREIDVRSQIYSLGALLYFMEAGLEKYAVFRARSVQGEAENLFGDVEGFSHRIGMVVADTVLQDPEKRIPTFAKVIEAIDRARTAPEQSNIQTIAILPRADDAAEPPPVTDAPPAEEVIETTPPIEPAGTSTEPRAGDLMIPPELLGVAEQGTVLRLNRIETKSGEQVAAFAGNTFRIGRSVDAELITRFLPRNKSNDTKTKRLSKTHVTARCEGRQVLLADGSGIKQSANGSAFDGLTLSAGNPIPLVNPGELKLAETYTVRIIPLLEEADGTPVIGNLGDWSGPQGENNLELAGAILFRPNEQSEVDLTLWLFSKASFASSSVAPFDFKVTDDQAKTGALHFFRDCFWIEQRSTQSLLVDGLALGVGEIAPLKTGQTIEVSGGKYAVQIEDRGKHAMVWPLREGPALR